MFTALTDAERRKLLTAINSNHEGRTALLTNRQTGFVDSIPINEADIPDEEVVNAIASVPVHY